MHALQLVLAASDPDTAWDRKRRRLGFDNGLNIGHEIVYPLPHTQADPGIVDPWASRSSRYVLQPFHWTILSTFVVKPFHHAGP